jgi:hypothetical protein
LRERKLRGGRDNYQVSREKNKIRCGDEILDQVDKFDLTVNLSGTPVRNLIEPSP